MNKQLLSIALIFSFCITSVTAAIPKEVIQAGKSLFTVYAYDNAGQLLRSCNGFFITEDGTAISDYKSFLGASKATLIQADGKKSNVLRISGADDIYNLIKFTSDALCKTPLRSATDKTNIGSTMYILTHTGKKILPIETKIVESATVAKGVYYTLSIPYKESYVCCPLVNAKGEVVGIVQKNSGKDAKTYAISNNTGTELNINALSFGSTTLAAVNIAKQIPQNEKDAATYIFLLGQTSKDSIEHVTALNDFIKAYPQNTDGYLERAKFFGLRGLYENCQKDILSAVNVSAQKDMPHYTFSRIIYQNALYNKNKDTQWTLAKALQEADAAYSINPLPLYSLQQGQCYYGMQQYQQAFDKFEAVNKSDLASSETFFYAAQAKGKMEAPLQEIIVLLDSAIARFQPPYSKAAAPYFWERAKYLNAAGKYRETVLDLNEYEHIIGFNNLNDKFYYMREQAALESHIYQQAVDDINRCVAMRPNNYSYKIEKATLLIQLGQLDEAIVTARQAIQLDANNAEGYKILGIAFGEKKQKKAALENLQKAKNMGAENMDAVIKEYSK